MARRRMEGAGKRKEHVCFGNRSVADFGARYTHHGSCRTVVPRIFLPLASPASGQHGTRASRQQKRNESIFVPSNASHPHVYSENTITVRATNPSQSQSPCGWSVFYCRIWLYLERVLPRKLLPFDQNLEGSRSGCDETRGGRKKVV